MSTIGSSLHVSENQCFPNGHALVGLLKSQSSTRAHFRSQASLGVLSMEDLTLSLVKLFLRSVCSEQL